MTLSIGAYPDAASISAVANKVLRQAPERFAVPGIPWADAWPRSFSAPQRVTGIALLATDYRGLH